MSLRLSSSVRVPFLPVAKMSQMCRLLRRLERVVARRRCCSFLFLRRVVPSVVQVILRARRVVEPAWGGVFGAVLGRFRRMLVRRNLISQYHNITISQFSLGVLRRIFNILYPLMFRILRYSVSSGIRYPQALSGIITNITIFARCPQANFNSQYPLVFGILWYLVSSGIRYPLVSPAVSQISQFSHGVLRRILIVGILWYLVSSGIWYPLVFGI